MQKKRVKKWSFSAVLGGHFFPMAVGWEGATRAAVLLGDRQLRVQYSAKKWRGSSSGTRRSAPRPVHSVGGIMHEASN